MSTIENRNLDRNELKAWEAPIHVQVNVGDEVIHAQVLNFHFKGACLKVNTGDRRLLRKNLSLNFYLGKNLIKSNQTFKVCWENLNNDGLVGIQFLEQPREIVNRSKRFPSNDKFPPVIITSDPMTVSRKIYFKVLDMSQTGMKISTSLTNKHLFSGMQLKNAELQIPGQNTICLSLQICRTNESSSKNDFELGVGILSNHEEYKTLIKKYISQMSPIQASEDRLELLFKEGYIGKWLNPGIHYKFVTTEKEYEKILQLRLKGYSFHGKIKKGQSLLDMGEGLVNEGKIIAAYLGSDLIASAELRFGDECRLRFIDEITANELKIDLKKSVEINKLVVHPNAQNTDTVVGMFQRLHALVCSNGQYDIILSASDKLLSFYQSIGAQNLNCKIKHPSLENHYLNLMKIPPSAYRDGQGVNPFTWDIIYLETNKLLHRIGEIKNFEKNRIKKKIQKTILKPFYFLFKRKKNNRDLLQLKTKKTQEIKFTNDVPHQWTKQHIISSVLYPYILVADEKIGKHKVDLILEELSVPRLYILKKGNWLSVEFMNNFLEKYKKYGSISELSIQSGLRSMKKECLGINYYVLKLLTAQQAFQAISKHSLNFNKTRTYKLIDISQNQAHIEVGLGQPDLKPLHKESCLNWIASFEGVIKHITGKNGIVHKQKCIYHGDTSCTYQLKWISSTSNLKIATILFLFTTSSYFFIFNISPFNFFINNLIFVFNTFIMIFIFYFLKYLKVKKNYNLLFHELSEFRTEAEENYQKLQDSKNITDLQAKESLLLQQTSTKILKSKDLRGMLNTTLDDICEVFGFSRAFVMLIDEKKEFLRTSAVSGILSNADLLWKFSVDIKSKKEGSIFISSCFLSGNPVLIMDTEKHLHQYNQNSQEIIKNLNTDSFCIVPIPSDHSNWGVLIADKKNSTHLISQRDVQLLERVGQQLGIALDKKSLHDHEKRLNNFFQKYVPPQILQDILKFEHPRLGGQKRNVICMFVDIRGFSKISTQIPPETSLNYLNDFFELLNSIVISNGGYIDKFLGDGAMITWGARGDQNVHPNTVIDSAFQIISQSKILSDSFVKNGLPSLHIGIGIHQGGALVGNVGSLTRMESTVIGEVINFASRLESLNKKFNSQLIISEDIWKCLDTHSKNQFTQKQNIQIKGWKKPVSILILNSSLLGDTRWKKAS